MAKGIVPEYIPKAQVNKINSARLTVYHGAIDARLAIGGTIMIIAGIALSIHLESTTPVGMHGMSNEEIDDLLFEQRISGDIGKILLGVGLLLLLLSFGTKIPKRGSKSKDSNDVKKP